MPGKAPAGSKISSPSASLKRDWRGGPSHGAVVDREKFDRILDEYYQARGWDEKTGLQKKETLERLGLKDIAKDLAKRGRLG